MKDAESVLCASVDALRIVRDKDIHRAMVKFKMELETNMLLKVGWCALVERRGWGQQKLNSTCILHRQKPCLVYGYTRCAPSCTIVTHLVRLTLMDWKGFPLNLAAEKIAWNFAFYLFLFSSLFILSLLLYSRTPITRKVENSWMNRINDLLWICICVRGRVCVYVCVCVCICRSLSPLFEHFLPSLIFIEIFRLKLV